MALTLSSNAFAQEPDDTTPPPPATPTAPPADQKNVTQVGATTPHEPTRVEDKRLFGVLERLPPSAFPDTPIRGIAGGSLASTFHGLQWPYYPKTGIGVSGYAWIDSGYEHISTGNSTEQGIKYMLQQGRLVLRVTPTWSDGTYFVQSQAELVANKDQSQSQPNTVDVDDVWIKVGKWKSWDIQLGRYEGWEVYHFGMGLDLYTLERNGATDAALSAPAIYGLTYAFYRPAGVGQAALHLYPTNNLRFELGTQFGNEFGSNTLAVRPVGILDYGWVKLKAGVEYKDFRNQKDDAQDHTKQRGVGGGVQFVIDPYVEFGVNGAYGLADTTKQDGTTDDKGSNTTYSVGGFANVRIVEDLLLGGGLNYTYLEDLHFDSSLGRVEKFRHVQTFGAIQYLVAKQLYVKAVVAYADADFAPNFNTTQYSNQMVSARVRLLYPF